MFNLLLLFVSKSKSNKIQHRMENIWGLVEKSAGRSQVDLK